MRRWQKVVIGVIIAISIITGIGIGLFNILVDENSLSIKEKEWLDNNKSKVLSIAIPNDLHVFGNTGAGVFFDFVDYVNENLEIDINKNTISYLTESEGYGFFVSNSYDKNSLLLYKDHYVLVSKTTGIISDGSTIKDLKVGVLNSNIDIVKKYYVKNAFINSLLFKLTSMEYTSKEVYEYVSKHSNDPIVERKKCRIFVARIFNN